MSIGKISAKLCKERNETYSNTEICLQNLNIHESPLCDFLSDQVMPTNLCKDKMRIIAEDHIIILRKMCTPLYAGITCSCRKVGTSIKIIRFKHKYKHTQNFSDIYL